MNNLFLSLFKRIGSVFEVNFAKLYSLLNGMMLVLYGCTQPYVPLTPKGEAVEALIDDPQSHGCIMVGESRSIGLMGELNSYRHAMNLTRNRLADKGATHLSIIHSETGPMATVINAKGWFCKNLKKKMQSKNVKKDSLIILE